VVNYDLSVLHDCESVRCKASRSLESRPWLSGVTWRHRSRDHWTRPPIGGQWWVMTIRLSCTVMEPQSCVQPILTT